jgi:hypothetical protein
VRRARAAMTRTISRHQRGVAAIEFALVFGVLFLGIYGLVTFSGVLYVQQVVSRAAEDGARASQMLPGSMAPADLQTTVRTAIYRSLAHGKQSFFEGGLASPTNGGHSSRGHRVGGARRREGELSVSRQSAAAAPSPHLQLDARPPARQGDGSPIFFLGGDDAFNRSERSP